MPLRKWTRINRGGRDLRRRRCDLDSFDCDESIRRYICSLLNPCKQAPSPRILAEESCLLFRRGDNISSFRLSTSLDPLSILSLSPSLSIYIYSRLYTLREIATTRDDKFSAIIPVVLPGWEGKCWGRRAKTK